jgi:hypothetical protein
MVDVRNNSDPSLISARRGFFCAKRPSALRNEALQGAHHAMIGNKWRDFTGALFWEKLYKYDEQRCTFDELAKADGEDAGEWRGK